jgi:hypothetical protein
MREIPSEIRALLSDTDITEIAAHPVQFTDDKTLDAVDLAWGWASRVRKMDNDRALPWSDRTVWNEHDLAGSLFIRNFLQKALEKVPESVRPRLQDYVDQADAQFRSYTVDDPAGKMARIAHVDLAGRPWWWRRVPVSGPITEDLARW